MLSWQVGRVKITRVVEMDLPVPAACLPQATATELRKLPWLYPHFVKRGRQHAEAECACAAD